MAMKRTWFRGHLVNERTQHMLELAERRLGYKLDIMQGSYNGGGVAASAGTHDGGGAVDINPHGKANEITRALREVGFAAWHRLPSQGPWSEHVHAIGVGDPELSRGARTQVGLYYRGLNGLANGGKDDGPRLDPIPTWPIYLPKISLGRVAEQFKTKNPVRTPGVQKIQRMLNKRYNKHLVTDGVSGPKTRKAYKDALGTSVPTEKNLKKLVDGYYRVI